MKKTLLIMLLFISAAGSLQAQTFSEWFRQKKTQKKYLLQQIAALQVYIDYSQKGYKIAKGGFSALGDFTKEEFSLHNDYLGSLKIVKPEIRRSAKVADIMAIQLKIMQDYHRIYSQISRNNAFNTDELEYINRVSRRLLNECEETLDELGAVTTDNKLEMKDNERMDRMDKLYEDMLDKYTFSKNFFNDTRMLAAERAKENADVQIGRALQGIRSNRY